MLAYTVHGRPTGSQFPLTGGWVQRVSRKLGTPVGEHRALRIVRLLIKKGLIVPAGSYRQQYHARQPSGFRVRLYRTARQVKVSVRRPRPRNPWWKHPLFGFGVEKYRETGLPKSVRGWRPLSER